MKRLGIFKIGGRVIDEPEELKSFLRAFAHIPSPKLLVHGGGKWVSEMSDRLGLAVKMEGGRRVTDAATLDVVSMILPGRANKKIVALLQGYGCNALGLTGADGNFILAEKRPVVNGLDFGFVGDVVRVDSAGIRDILKLSITPVFTAMTHDGRGQLLNTNADTVASVLAVGLSEYYKVDLYYCFERPGVLKDPADDHSVIKRLTSSIYEKYKEAGMIHTGMLPKVDNAFNALKNGVSRVHICHFKDIETISAAGSKTGTLITL